MSPHECHYNIHHFKIIDDLCYNTFAKDGNDMKRIFLSIIVGILLIGLFGCDNNQIEDKIPPYFTNLNDFTYTTGNELPDLLTGVIATDAVDGDLTASITVDDSEVDWTKAGTYPIFYHVIDQAGNDTTASALITITLAPHMDTIAPTISGLSQITYVIGNPLPDLLNGIVVQDETDGNLMAVLIVDDTSVDYTLPGMYDIIYSVSDESGNEASLVRKINVTESIPDTELTVYYINDTHGAIEAFDNQLGLSHIGNLVINEKELNPDTTLFIGGGDLLQGNILSNYYYGSSMIDIFNVMKMDAFVLGNHEFDWGLEQVTRYFDPSSDQIHAAFPLLGANILRKDTMERPDFVDAYTIVQKGTIKVGIIGLMGYGLEDSIATARISEYMFDDPIYWASYYANYLRTEEDVDVILAVVHGNSDITNRGIAALSGNSKVDAIFNGHSHSRYTETITRSGVDVPVIQSKANGEYVGEVTFIIDSENQIKSYQVTNLHPTRSSNDTSDRIEIDQRLITPYAGITDLINEYKLVIDDLLNEVIITSSSYYDQEALSDYMAEIIRKSVDADLGIHNYGGTRASLSLGQDITVATLYQIFPFDNRVKHVYLTGSDIKDFINSQVAISYRSGLSLSGIEDDVYYKVATNDYIFDKIDYPFIYGVDPEDTGLLIRDLLEVVLRNQAKNYPSFRIDQPIVLTPVSFNERKYLFY